MAMQTGPLKEGEPNSDINTTPLIDVMLVLLIMLIVTLPVPSHAMKLDTPVPCEDCPEPPPEPIRISIDFDGALAWNGLPVVAADLDQRFNTEAHRAKQAEVHIEPHRLARYGQVAHVMAVAQREGMTKLGVVGGM